MAGQRQDDSKDITILSHLEKTGNYVCDNRVTHKFTLSLGPKVTL
jgi:hypothetical protein